MRNKRFQNRISESSVTLPLCMVTGTLVWFWNADTQSFGYSISSVSALALAVLSTYVVMETANVFALLRIRSNMVATVWVIGISLMTFTHAMSAGWFAALALAGSYYVMFLCYQRHEPVIHVFHTFLLLGVASMAVPQLIVFVPLYYWYLLVFLRCLTWRGFWAGMVGLALPMCFLLGWSIVSMDYTFLMDRVDSILSTRLFVADNYGWMMSYRSPEAQSFAFFSILSFIGIVHYLRNYYNDKIRTRMYLYIYVMQTAVCWLIVLCLPHMYHVLIPVFMLGASTMIAHFFALTNMLVSNLFFCLILTILILQFVINLGIWKF